MRAWLAVVCLLVAAAESVAMERVCDPQLEDCREPILRLIRTETQGIDVAFWYMSDARYAAALIKRHKAGVPVRLLMDARAPESKSNAARVLTQLAGSGIPMRSKRDGAILHWKMFLFHGQHTVEFSKANYTPHSFVPGHLEEGGRAEDGWFDEAVYFTSDPRIVESFRTQFETYWTDPQRFMDYAGITTPPTRAYPVTPIDPDLNFHPDQDFTPRVLQKFAEESVGIDLIEFRIVGEVNVIALIDAINRGVMVRIITEPEAFGNPTRSVHVLNLNRLMQAGARIKARQHTGLTHEGLIVLRGLREAIFGSANLSTAQMMEHNLFIGPQTAPLDTGESVYEWFRKQFHRKWMDPQAFRPWTLTE